jgi:transposase-like protein
VIDVYVSPTRDTDAATHFLRQAVERTGVRPHTATTDRAAIYPPAPRAVLPGARHRAGKAEQQGIERDHQHFKRRYRSMWEFKVLRCAQTFRAVHGFVRDPREGFNRLGVVMGNPEIPRAPRAWDEITYQLQAD